MVAPGVDEHAAHVLFATSRLAALALLTALGPAEGPAQPEGASPSPSALESSTAAPAEPPAPPPTVEPPASPSVAAESRITAPAGEPAAREARPAPGPRVDRCKAMSRQVRGACFGHELNINGFRAPSIGLEYRYSLVSIHTGAYTTIISKDDRGRNEATWFIKSGATLYFLPISLYRQRPSEFYVSASHVYGFQNDWEGKHGFIAELGWRWMVWRGINLRIGVAVLVGEGSDRVRVNPTPGIGYSVGF
jgi:hypothetical protein